MSNLISKNQRSTAQEPEVVEQPPIPKPPRRLQEFDLQPAFEQGFDPNNRLAGLEIATEEQLQTDTPEPSTFESGESVEFTAPGVVGGESEVGLTRYLGGQLSESLPVQLPNVPAASTPPMTSLWKDATVDLGVPNLADARLVTTAFPSAYADPLTVGFDPGVGQTFGAGVQANAAADAQRTAAIAKAAQDFQNTRGNLPNTPDASKPWHEQLWGWAGDLLQGTEQERATEERTGKGTFGAYGSGLGGFFKSAFGVPIALATAAGAEGYGRLSYETQKRIAEATNPFIVVSDGKTNRRVRYNAATAEQKHQYALDKSGENLLFPGSGNVSQPNYDPRRPFGSFIVDALSGEVNDSINEANPKLPPVVDRRTGKPAVAKPARGLLQSANLRPGQEWYEDGAGSALEIATQLFSPGNKVDAAGELVGLGLSTLARTNVAKATGRAIANAVPQSVKKGARGVANVGKRTVQAVQQGNFGSVPVAPISKPTSVVGLPMNRGAEFEAYLRNNGVRQTKPPVVANVPAFSPKQTPIAPKTDPEGLSAVVGIGQKGEPITFVPTTSLRSHSSFIESLRATNPERFSSYKGTTWAEWSEWKAANLSEQEFRQLEAVGSPLFANELLQQLSTGKPLFADDVLKLFEEGKPLLAEDVLEQLKQADVEGRPLTADDVLEMLEPKKTPTLDDLQTQAKVLAEQKLSVEAPLKQLEETFDELVDVGRREIDELPLRPLTADDVLKALDYGSSLRISRSFPPSLVGAAAKGDWETFMRQVEASGGLKAFVDTHNGYLQNLSPRVVEPATSRLATNAPTTVYHGTALENWSPDYSFSEFGSRGELGSGLYSTSSLEEAEYYARATVSNSRSVEVAYEPLSPQVVELDTSQLQAPLDARLPLATSDELVEAVVENLPSSVKQQMDSLDESLSFAELVAKTEVAAAKAGGSEELLRQVSDNTADTLREFGYDSAWDAKSGWYLVVDNSKLKVRNARVLQKPTTTEAAVARYNADSVAAGHFPDNVTSDANLRDSAFQLLDTARNQLDEKLEEVQAQLAEATYKEEPPTPAATAKAQSFDELRARAKEPPSVERYVRDIQDFGQPLHPVLLREKGLNPRTYELEYEVIGNFEAYEAALASYNPRTYAKVGAMVENASKGFSNYQLADITAIRGKSYKPIAPASTKEQVLKEFSSKNPHYTSAPVVLEETALDVYRVLDRGYTANAYKQLKQEQVPSIVVGRDGKATFVLVDLATIEKKAKPLEPEVPKLESILKPQELLIYSQEFGKRLTNIQSIFEKRLQELGINLPELKRLGLQKSISANDELNGLYKGKMDVVLLEAARTDEELASVLAHEYTHVLEHKLKDVDLDEFRSIISKEASGYFPSEYSRTNKTEYMAEVAQAIFRGDEVPTSIKEAFISAWKKATAKAQPSVVQTEARMTELLETAVKPDVVEIKPSVIESIVVEPLRPQKLTTEVEVQKLEEVTKEQRRRDKIVDYLRIKSDNVDVERMLSNVRREEQWVAEATAEEAEEAAEALANANLGYQVVYLQKHSDFIPDMGASVNKAKAVLDNVKLKRKTKGIDQRATTIQEYLRIDEQETRRLLSDAQAVVDNPDDLSIAKRFEGSLLLHEKKVAQVPGAKALEPNVPKPETAKDKQSQLTTPDNLNDRIDIATKMLNIGSSGDARGWSMLAQSTGARLLDGLEYLKGNFSKAKTFDLDQDVVGYANQIIRNNLQEATVYVNVSQDLGVDVAELMLSTAKASVEKLAKDNPDELAAAIKRMGVNSQQYKTNVFAQYANDLLKGKADASKALDEAVAKFKEFQQTPNYKEDVPLNTADGIADELSEDYLEWERNKEIQMAKKAEGMEYDTTYEGANPHASLRDALESTVDDSPNICKF